LQEKVLSLDQEQSILLSKLETVKEELDHLRERNKEVDDEAALLRPRVEYLQLDKAQMELDLKAASEKLNIAIKAKNALDIVNNELKEDLEKYREELKVQEEANTKQRFDTEYWRGKFIELERENLLGESQKSALEKESEIIKESLNEKIKMLEERVTIEIEAKNSLIIHASKEEKSHSETRNSLLKIASELENYKLRYKNAEHKLESKNKALNELLAERATLQSNLLKMENERDVIKLEVDKNVELLKRLEIFYKTKLETKKAKIKGLKKENSLNEVQLQLIQEDLYSRCSQLYKSLNEYITKVLFLT